MMIDACLRRIAHTHKSSETTRATAKENVIESCNDLRLSNMDTYKRHNQLDGRKAEKNGEKIVVNRTGHNSVPNSTI